MPGPKAAVFDLGKVLVDFDYSIAGRRIAARGKMSAAEVQKFIDHSPLLFRFETGQILLGGLCRSRSETRDQERCPRATWSR